MLRAAIIGAGRIAQGYNTPGDGKILTHAAAYKDRRDVELVAICDLDVDRARAAAKLWDIPSCAKKPEELAGERPDIISICTNTETHAAILESAIALRPRAIFCEKPIAATLADAERLSDACAEQQIQLTVNYSRRFIKAIQAAAARARGGRAGRLVSARMKYYGGLFNNGSHLINLLQAFINFEIAAGAAAHRGESAPGDPTLSGAFVLQCADGEKLLSVEGYPPGRLTPLELELIFEDERILIEERDGTRVFRSILAENSSYPGYFEFAEPDETRADPSEPMRNAVAHVINRLSGLEEPISDGISAVRTLRACLAMSAAKAIR